jgi:hypothetical protein
MSIAETSDAGNRIRDQEATRRKAKTRASQEIGEPPDVVDPQRRERCLDSFGLFCTTYDPLTFNVPFGRNGLKAIDRIEETVIDGGLYALAEPRGDGKTSKLRMASVWSVLKRSRKYPMYVGANATKAHRLLSAVKTLLSKNRRLYEDFAPELHGFWSLDGEARQAIGQRYRGEKTGVEWAVNLVRFAQMECSVCSGAAFQASGIESADIRGSSFPGVGGEGTLRPDFVIIDDPQTDDTARSQLETQKRYETIMSGILGTEGDIPLSGVMLVTCIRKGDLADRVLDRKQCPEWRGERMKLLDALPTNLGLWDKYAEIKHECLRMDRPITEATEFVRANYDAMHEGAIVPWPERTKGRLSAVQYAMDLYYRDVQSFWAEYQNEPIERDKTSTTRLTPSEICDRVNGHERGVAPVDATALTAFIDVQGDSLWYVVCWWAPDFTGGVLDYGVFPDQGRSYFSLGDVAGGGKSLADKYPTAGFDGQLFAGLTDLTKQLIGSEWARDDGTPMRIDRCLIDANWGRSTKLVKRFCRQSPHASVLIPSHGRFVGASSTPFDQYPDKSGEKTGEGWRMPKPAGGVRHVAWDINFWKSFFHARMSTPMGDPGNFTLFGRSPGSHRMFADHCSAEYSVRVEAKGRVVDEWKEKPDKPDNHWFDGVVGCTMAATMCGVELRNAGNVKKPKKERITLSQMMAKR